MSTYLREMNLQVWWMVDVALSHTLEDCPQTQAQIKCLYLKAHASNALSSGLSAEIKDEIEMECDWPERANLLWKVLEQMYGSSNDKRSSINVPENVSSSSTHFDQDQEEQSSVQKEDDCSMSNSDVNDDDDDTNDEELLVEFKKLISKHMKLQKR
jgi:hypothetical protein